METVDLEKVEKDRQERLRISTMARVGGISILAPGTEMPSMGQIPVGGGYIALSGGETKPTDMSPVQLMSSSPGGRDVQLPTAKDYEAASAPIFLTRGGGSFSSQVENTLAGRMGGNRISSDQPSRFENAVSELTKSRDAALGSSSKIPLTVNPTARTSSVLTTPEVEGAVTRKPVKKVENEESRFGIY